MAINQTSDTQQFNQPSEADFNFVKVAPYEPSARDFNFRVGTFGNPYGTRSNVVFRWGYNAGGVLADDNTEPAMYECLETFFAPNSAQKYFELYWEYVNGETNYRPFGISIDRADNVASIFYKADYTHFMGTDSTQYWTMNKHNLIASHPSCVLVKTTNNTPFLQQRNAAGNGNINLIYLDAQDKIIIGGGTQTARAWKLATGSTCAHEWTLGGFADGCVNITINGTAYKLQASAA